jgi:hypothetical protein
VRAPPASAVPAPVTARRPDGSFSWSADWAVSIGQSAARRLGLSDPSTRRPARVARPRSGAAEGKVGAPSPLVFIQPLALPRGSARPDHLEAAAAACHRGGIAEDVSDGRSGSAALHSRADAIRA